MGPVSLVARAVRFGVYRDGPAAEPGCKAAPKKINKYRKKERNNLYLGIYLGLCIYFILKSIAAYRKSFFRVAGIMRLLKDAGSQAASSQRT